VWRDLKVLVSPRLLPLHLLGLAATVIGVMLGLWQLDAWQAQRAAEARDLSSLAPVPLGEVLSADEPFPASGVGRPVTLAGEWLPESTFYVSGREDAGRDGLWAITPVAVCDEPAACERSAALLVVRGWTPTTAEAPAAPAGPVELTGWLQPPEGSALPDLDPEDDVIPEVRIADAIQRVDQDLYGAYLIAEEAAPAAALDGLEPVTPESLPEPDTGTGLRNLLYGIQWFVFVGFALFIWWRWARDEVERSRRAEQAADAEVARAPEVPSST
jgi:cytochrome oxidase assembly protein ShyY1